MSRPRTACWRTDDGVALIGAMLAVLVLTGLAVVMLATAVSQSRSTASARSFEAALHVAESGIDELLAVINQVEDADEPSTFVLTCAEAGDADGPGCGAGDTTHTYDPATDDDVTWVDANVGSVDDRFVFSTSDGDVVVLRPDFTGAELSTNPNPVIFAVGYIPSRANPEKVRMVKVEIDRQNFTPLFAIQTEASLRLSGDAEVLDGSCPDPSAGCTQQANVHSNGSISQPGVGAGDNGEFEGTVSAKGTVDPTLNANDIRPGDTTVPTPPLIEASDFYSGSQDSGLEWWDLCADGKVRNKSLTGTPCSGTIHLDMAAAGAPGQFKGWTYSATQSGASSCGQGVLWKNTAMQPGVYYVQGGSAQVNGTSGGKVKGSVFVERLSTDVSGRTGHFCVSGNPSIDAGVLDAAVIADGDIRMRGSGSGSTIDGFISAREQLDLSGSVAIAGAALAQDVEDTVDSPVHENLIGGSITLTWTPGLQIRISGVVRVTDWNEV